jgi:hypothetical protein
MLKIEHPDDAEAVRSAVRIVPLFRLIMSKGPLIVY